MQFFFFCSDRERARQIYELYISYIAPIQCTPQQQLFAFLPFSLSPFLLSICFPLYLTVHPSLTCRMTCFYIFFSISFSFSVLKVRILDMLIIMKESCLDGSQ